MQHEPDAGPTWPESTDFGDGLVPGVAEQLDLVAKHPVAERAGGFEAIYDALSAYLSEQRP